MSSIVDRFGRPLRSLRVSVTDRCNLRCHYCMPKVDYAWLPRDTLLTFEESRRLPRSSAPSASTACASPAVSRCCGAAASLGRWSHHLPAEVLRRARVKQLLGT